MILTLDVGSSFTKCALVDEVYELHEVKTWPTEYDELSQKINDLVSNHSPDHVGIATGLAYSRKRILYWVEDDRRVDILDASDMFLYNDAEAAAIALNLTLRRRAIQATSNEKSGTDQALVYLGTGFQFVPTVSTGTGYKPNYTLGCLMHAAGNVLYGKRRIEIAKAVGVLENELRMTHLLSSQGLCGIHQVVTGRSQTAYDIIEGENPETFFEYSEILGRALQAMVTGCSVWGGLVIGGTFASAISRKLEDRAIIDGFNDVGSIFKSAMASIPISIIEDKYATNKAIAFGIRNRIETAVYAIE